MRIGGGLMVLFHRRTDLGLGEPVPSRLRERTEAEAGLGHRGLTWHWTGEGGRLFHPDPFQRLRGIWAYHVDTLGYGDVAYEGAYDADGNTFELRHPRFVGAHAQSTDNEANRVTDGIVFLEDARGFTQAAADAFVWWTNIYRLAHRRTPEMWPHRWWGDGHGGLPTSCPGNSLAGIIAFTHGYQAPPYS